MSGSIKRLATIRATLVVLSVPTIAFAQASLAQESYSTPAKQSQSARLKPTNAILISKYMLFSGPEALLITNQPEIESLVRLLADNETTGHACGYHWAIRFRLSPTVSVPFSHNEECESYRTKSAKINSLIRTYSHLIKTNPTHFIYNVTVAASLEPEDAVKNLEYDSKLVFFFRGTEERLPHIRIQASAHSEVPANRRQWERAKSKNVESAEMQLKETIDRISQQYTVTHTTKLDRRYSRFGAGIIEDRVETTVHFPYGTTLIRVEDVLSGVRLLEKKVPTDYVLQLVSDERFSDEVKQRLMTAHPFVVNVLPFPK